MRKFIVLAVLALASVSAAAQSISNFQQVSPGIFRGGSPDAGDLQYLAGRGIKTIISLQGDMLLPMPSERSGARRRARQISESLGMGYMNAPVPAMSPLTSRSDAALRRVAAAIANPKNQPVFVHCSLGDDRTGLAIAVYRVLYEGWSADQAYAEMKARGHGGIQKLFTPSLKMALYRIARQQ